MQSIGQQLGIGNLEVFGTHPSLVTNDAVGVELELEGFTSRSIETASSHLHPLWSVTNDGSLRNGGVEFITRGGLGGERLHAAFERMVSLLDRVNYDASWRCSTHMHINMLDFTINQVARFMMVYAACEPVLFQHCGSFRRSSNFCTPVGDSVPFHKNLISRLHDDVIQQGGASSACNKYTALNFMPLFGDGRNRALGTVEFRGGRPMVTLEDMTLQANLLLSIKQFVRSFEGNEEQMLSALSSGVCNVVFTNGIADTLIPPMSDLEDSLIHAWLLLKAYQEGLAAPRPEPEEIAPPRPARPFGMSELLFQQTMTSNHTQLQALQAMVQAETDWYSSGESEGHTVEYERPEQTGFSSTDFRTLYRFWGDLTVGDMRSKRTRAIDCLAHSSTAFCCNVVDARRVVLSWLLNKDVTGEQTPVPSMVRAIRRRMILGVNHSVVRTEMFDRTYSLMQQPEIQGRFITNRVDYCDVLGDEQKVEIANLLGVPVADLTSKIIWNYLTHKEVVVRAPRATSTALNRATGITIDFSQGSSRFSASAMYFYLRWADRKSSMSISKDYLARYDKVVAVMEILFDANCGVPVLLKGTLGRNDKIHIADRDSMLEYLLSDDQMAYSTTPRVSRTTGKTIY